MRKILIISALALLSACSNNKKDDKPAAENPQPTANTTPTNTENNTTPPVITNNSSVTIEGKEIGLNGSILVDKDEKKLQPGAPYRGMITSSSGPNNEGFILRFVFDTKPGTYPVTGQSFNRGKDAAAEQYGGLLGGEEKIYDSKVILTECKDLGDNGLGGHKWSISGTVENLTIPAMGIMLWDKESKHPKEIKLDKITFSNLTFDDNAEEMLKKAMDQLKNMKKN